MTDRHLQYSRFRFCAVPLLLAGFCGVTASVARAADKVSAGVLTSAGDMGLFLAEARGYFKAENLDVTLTHIDSAVRMMPSLGSGDLDVGGGATSDALYNAASRQIDVRVVASRARTAPGYGYQGLIIRKDIVDSGRYKTYADLKGLKFGFASPDSTPHSSLNEAAKKGGIAFADIPIVYMNFGAQVAALQSGAIDGTIMVEPYLSQVIASGAAVQVAPTEDFYPAAEVSLLLYGDRFIKQRPDVAKRFMETFLHGARDYSGAIDNGRWRNDANAGEVIQIFARAVNMPEAIVRRTTPQYPDPDGAMNVPSLAINLAFFKSTGKVTDKDITAQSIVNASFAQAAARELGPYARMKQ